MKKDTINKFYSAYKLYIFPAIIILSGLILIIFIIYPQANKFIADQKVEQELLKKSSFLEDKAKILESYDQNDLRVNVGHALAAYPTERDFSNVFGLLQNLTSQSGYSLIAITLGGGSGKSGDSQTFLLKLEVIGSLSSTKNLISTLEDSPRIMRMNSMETTVGIDPNLVSTFLNLDVLYSSIPEVFGSIDSPLPELSQKDEELLARLAKAAPQTQPQTIQLGPRGKANPFE